MKLSTYRVKPGHKVRLSDYPTADHDGFKDKDAGNRQLDKHREQLAGLQQLFYASQRKALLIVLQGMDTAGKDGVIRHIFSGINPQGCDVTSFKTPTPEEARHDFLWRIQKATPERGMIGIFNRSHYEDLLSPRACTASSTRRPSPAASPRSTPGRRRSRPTTSSYSSSSCTSHAASRPPGCRPASMTPGKHWKLSAADLVERQFWPQYVAAYEHILSHTSRRDAPWFIIPADHKWYRNAVVGGVLAETMRALKLKLPKSSFNPSGLDLHKLSPAAAAAKQALALEPPPAK